MGNRVSLKQLDSYSDAQQVEQALLELLEPLGGIAAFVKPGAKVLLKPNMLSGKAADRAVTTHPAIVRAVARLVQQAGGVVSLGDSPGIGSPEQVVRKCGLQQVIDETGISFAPFKESVSLPLAGGTFHELEVARDILDADVIINLPKLKTHQMMGLTCAVKNMFGAVVGLRKPRLHLQAGTDKEFFALLLLELCEAIAPALTIVDAVVGMEGDGPGSGDPVNIGALIAGASPQAIDTVVTELVGMRPEQVWTQKVAAQTKRPLTSLSEIELFGEALEEMQIPAFRAAKTTDVNFGLKGGARRLLRNALTARPEVDVERCRLCNDCVTHCPPEAMEIRNQRLIIDYDRCIRCFCCQELCPHAALMTHQGWLLRLHSFFHGD